MLSENKRLVLMGASLIPIRYRDKNPVEPEWQKRPRYKYEELKPRFKRRHNIGIRLGEHSKIGGNFQHCFDVDIRVAEDAPEAWAAARELLPGYDLQSFPMVQSGSGGESRHIHFVTSRPFKGKKLARSTKTFKDAEGHTHYNWEIEFFGTGKQVLLPPSIHPSGGKYRWINPIEDEDDLPEIDADEIEQLLIKVNGHHHPMAHANGHDIDIERKEPIDKTIAEIEEQDISRLPEEWREDYDLWIKLGMAWHHQTDGSKEGLAAWDRFSRPSKKYNRRKIKYFWDRFQHERDKNVTMRTIILAANEAEREAQQATPDDFDDDLIGDAPEDEPSITADNFDDDDLIGDAPEDEERRGMKLDVPPHLLRPPGVLGLAVDFYNRSSEKYQPQFAVQCALALGSVVLGRYFKTDQRNFSSLYFLDVGPTACGKEHAKNVIEQVLEEADCDNLIGPETYTSDAGFISATLQESKHITILDEVGRVLQANRESGNANKSEVQTALMKAFGRLHGVYRGIGYSTKGMTKEQEEALKKRKVKRPAVTFYGMTTPSTLYAALKGDDVKSGFLNRFLIVETQLGRQLGNERVEDVPVPEELIAWVKEHAFKHAGDEDDDFMARADSSFVPDPIVVPFAKECEPLLWQMKVEQKEKMDELDKFDLADLVGRTREIAMRVALIVAVSDRSRKVMLKHLQWAKDYVFFYHWRMVDMIKGNLGKTELDGMVEKALDLIKKGKAKGAAQHDFGKYIRGYSSLSKRDHEEIVYRLKSFHDVKYVEIKGRRGPARGAYVHVDYIGGVK